MRTKIGLLFSCWMLVFACGLLAQPSERKNTPTDYITKYKDDAVREMQLYRVPASITLAQGMLESDNGNSALAVYANNHFGIKCHTDWKGDSYHQDDDEKHECFRKYPSVYDSYVDHSQFLKNRQRYAGLFELKITDYKGWARGLKAAGYATDPRYADRLIDIIERNKLYEYDKLESLPSASSPKPNAGQVTSAINGRQVFLNNDIKYVIVKADDTFSKIANDLNMGVWQLYKYNDMTSSTALQAGMLLYIQPKRRRAESAETHTLKPGETMHDISQRYGIRLKSLYKLNRLEYGTIPKSGEVLHLRKRKPAA